MNENISRALALSFVSAGLLSAHCGSNGSSASPGDGGDPSRCDGARQRCEQQRGSHGQRRKRRGRRRDGRALRRRRQRHIAVGPAAGQRSLPPRDVRRAGARPAAWSTRWRPTRPSTPTPRSPPTGNAQNQGTASVLYLEDGPAAAGCPTGAAGCKATARSAGSGLFFAFPALGSNPNVVAFDETTGQAVWTAHVTTGGDGIRGTPAIDPVSRRLFVVTGNNPHLVHALSVDTGVEATTGGWPVTLSRRRVTYNGATFNSAGQNQHGASLLANGILYIPFGGQYGDGGTYLGWIVAVDTTDPTRVGRVGDAEREVRHLGLGRARVGRHGRLRRHGRHHFGRAQRLRLSGGRPRHGHGAPSREARPTCSCRPSGKAGTSRWATSTSARRRRRTSRSPRGRPVSAARRSGEGRAGLLPRRH